ncbi:MAG: oligosaccharide flippase family protein [Gammaproteobacteria bacterium]|nr:oligosaccharide flippase family protein [Gammaproteobacteria bacterium]
MTGLAELATYMLLARLLAPAEYGAYFLAMSVVLFGAMLASLGLNQAAVRFVAEAIGLNQEARARVLLLRILKLGLIGSLTVAAGYFLVGEPLLALFLDVPALFAVTGLVALWIAVSAFQRLIAEGLRGFHDIRNATLFGGFLSGALTVGALGVSWGMQGEAHLAGVLAIVVIATAASALLGGWRLGRRVMALPVAKLPVGNREILHVAWPLLLTNLAVFVLTQVDLWILAAFRPAEEVARYGAASRLALVTMVVTSVLYAVLPPIIARQHARHEKHQLQRILRAGATFTSLVSLPVFLAFVIAPQWLLALVYGDYYADASAVLALLATGLFVNVITGMRGNVLMMTGNERIELQISLVGGAINIALCLVGAHYGGMLGVALAAMSAMVIQCLIEEVAVRRVLGIWTHASINSLSDIRRLFNLRGHAVPP